MACKCALIDKLEREIKWIRIAEEHASALVVITQHTNDNLTELSHMYATTVKAPADLASGFTKLDENAVANAQTLVTKLAEAENKAMVKLEKAIAEDDKYHDGHSIIVRREVAVDDVRIGNIM